MSSPAGQRFRLLASVLSVLLLLLAGAGGWFYWQLRASRPRLEGTVALPGLGAPVTVARDALGVPLVRGAARADVARALGYLHAQDRFFQMD
ncbi:MAG: penicillin acylase family protein, partial [Opitutales bacterium]|nr:penicillin acylase family protein [Opitutales bacterium]